MDPSRKKFVVGVIPALIFVPLALLLTVAPYLEPPGTVNLGEDGLSGVRDHTSQIENMSNPVARAMYSFGDTSCHQNSSRSFFLHGNQMPLCSRCISIYWGFAAGSLIALFRKVYIPLSVAILSFVPMGVDGLTQALTSYTSTNLIRPLTGFPSALLLAMVLVYSFQETTYIPPQKERQLLNSGPSMGEEVR